MLNLQHLGRITLLIASGVEVETLQTNERGECFAFSAGNPPQLVALLNPDGTACYLPNPQED